MTAVTMESILASVSQVFTAAIGWMGEVLTTVTSSPALLLMVICVPLVGLGVGLLGRLIRL